MTAVASPSRISTVSSTLCVCSGIWVPGAKVVMPVVTVLPSAFHLPTNGSVDTPVPLSNGSISAARSTIGGLGKASGMARYLTWHASRPRRAGPDDAAERVRAARASSDRDANASPGRQHQDRLSLVGRQPDGA